MRAVCFIFITLVCISTNCAAQPGRTGLGMRGSIDGVGITAKYFLDRAFAIEVQGNYGGIRALDGQSKYLTALMEYHVPLPIPAFRVFFGGGLHAGHWTDRRDATYKDEGILGLDGIGGLEYLFTRFPIGISGDLRLSINYVQEVEFMPHNILGVGIRYYFGSNKVKPFEYPWRIRRRFH
jgi:hypothetical protein